MDSKVKKNSVENLVGEKAARGTGRDGMEMTEGPAVHSSQLDRPKGLGGAQARPGEMGVNGEMMVREG